MHPARLLTPVLLAVTQGAPAQPPANGADPPEGIRGTYDTRVELGIARTY